MRHFTEATSNYMLNIKHQNNECAVMCCLGRLAHTQTGTSEYLQPFLSQLTALILIYLVIKGVGGRSVWDILFIGQ